LKDTYRSKDVLLPQIERHVMKSLTDARPDDHSMQMMHPSDLCKPDWCGRHDYYRIMGVESEKTAKQNPSFRMSNIWSEGTAIHAKFQQWLAEMGVLFGDWECRNCGHRYGALSPTTCQFCQSDRLTYRELPLLKRQMMVEGHADAAIHADWFRGLVEIKSIGVGTLRFDAPRLYNLYQDGTSIEDIWKMINRPFASHMRQGQLYLWLSWPAYEEIVFIYESKTHQAVKEFRVSYNKSLIAPILEDVREVAQGVRAGIVPDRPAWATDPVVKVCTGCEYRRTCWQLGAPHGTETVRTKAVTVQRGSSYRRKRALRPA
jgi:hypothetical protein